MAQSVPDHKEEATAVEVENRTFDDQTMSDVQKPVVVDTIHNDEGLVVLAGYTGDQHWEPQEEKRLRRKIDRRLLSILCITFALQYYDKAMIGQAAIFGLTKDLQLGVGNRYSFAASIFYLGFICGAYPAVLMAQRWPIERVAFGIVLVWGACLMCAAACHNYQALYAQRFFLGFLEAGIPPMFMMVVGGWYTKREQAFRMGIWYACSGYISSFSPLINYGIGHITSGSLHPWQYMYLLAGGITTLWSFVILFFLPSDPVRARGFSDRERYIAVARMRENNSGVRNTHFKMNQAIEALLDIKFWLIFCTAFLLTIVNGPVSSFVPIIINSFGFSTLNSLLLSMPGGFYGGTWELVAPLIAMKVPGMRSYLIIISELGVVFASFLLWFIPRDHKGALLFAVYILNSFGGGYAVMMGLQLANTSGYTKRSVTSSGLYVGYCLGNFVGPLCFKTSDAPNYTPGFITTCVTSIAAACLMVVYRLVCMWENRRRDKTGVMEGFDHAYEDDSTDMKNPQFRYVL
ncbi:hypothetical protein B7463_g1530, partial [Scytalidium lignicola]